MRERPSDLERLQALLDRSYERAGPHLASIHTEERRLDAASLAERLPGMRILAVATVTADGRPLTRPVDAFFYRGAFWFGSAPGSLTMRHLTARPAVSATHTVGETLAVTVHGTAHVVDLDGPEGAGFREVAREHYGAGWDDWAGDAVYARIDAERMLTFLLDEDAVG